MSVKVTGEGLAGIFEAIQVLTQHEVLIGIPHGETRSDADMTNAQLGYLHESGSPAMNLPARPFLVPGVEAVNDLTAKQLTKAAEESLKGNLAGVNRFLHIAGMTAQNSVRRYITTAAFTPLSQATINARLRAGKTRTKPLIDTGQLRNSITYVIRKKGE